jgi:hypothetical protein
LDDGSQIILLAFFIFLNGMFIRKQNQHYPCLVLNKAQLQNAEHFSEPPAKMSEGGVG